MQARLTSSRGLLAASIVLAAAFLVHSLWLPAKAVLGQVLLQRAWVRVQQGNDQAKPWPWADTSPLAVLEAPALDIRQIVLSGASDRNLAWGPVASSAGKIGEHDTVLSGHRDTHFHFLQRLQVGDSLKLRLPGGNYHYRIQSIDIVDSSRQSLALDAATQRLTLVTCYPFDALQAGGPLRYVLTALPESS